VPKGKPPWLPTRQFRTWPREGGSRLVDFALVNEPAAVVWMVQMNCIDMNAWYSRVDKPDRPDFVLFDLDPSADAGFRETVQVALLVKEALDALGLQSFPKTSSADGMHVLVPLERRHTYDDTREFSEIVAGALAGTNRGLVTTEWTKSKRTGVLIDANQNGEGKTIASVYSVRPRPGAPVSTPLRWDEVDESLDPTAFTMDVVRERIAKHGDLFEGVLKVKQLLGPALKKLQ
jgi:bifunctional non-homologous end joining protein LigD